MNTRNNVSPARSARLAQDPIEYMANAARARRLQGAAIGRAFGAAGRFIARGGSDLYRWIAAVVRKRQTIADLSRLDDHVLEDIGISRAQIPLIAQGLIAPSGETPRQVIPAAPCPSKYHGDGANDTKTTPVAA